MKIFIFPAVSGSSELKDAFKFLVTHDLLKGSFFFRAVQAFWFINIHIFRDCISLFVINLRSFYHFNLLLKNLRSTIGSSCHYHRSGLAHDCIILWCIWLLNSLLGIFILYNILKKFADYFAWLIIRCLKHKILKQLILRSCNYLVILEKTGEKLLELNAAGCQKTCFLSTESLFRREKFEFIYHFSREII